MTLSESDYSTATEESTELPSIWNQSITRKERRVRSETVDENYHPRTDVETIAEFDTYVSNKNSMKMKFENGTTTNSHRFSDAYARTKFGEVIGADKEIQADSNNLHCALITRRGTWWDSDGGGKPTIDFLDQLLESNRNVMQWYRRNLGKFARLTTIEHHANGYPHIHDHVWHWGELSVDELVGAIGCHIRNCEIAESDQHPKDGAIRAWKADPQPPDGDESRSARTSLVNHSTKHLCWNGAANSEPARKRVLSTLWASDVSSFCPDSTFREYVEKSQDSDKGEDMGTFEGIELANGDVIEKENMGDGGGSKFVVAQPRSPDWQ